MLELDLDFARDGFRLQARLRMDEPVCVLSGPSGCGKTTLLDLIAGLLRPTRGWIRLDGRALTDVAADLSLPPEARRLGYLFQEDRLFPHLSVEGNLRYGSRRRRQPGPAVDEVVQVLALGELLDRRPARLSGGERQRVALGRALLAAPRLLLLDEPLAGLDPALQERILPFLVTTIARFSIPTLLVSHAPERLAALAPRRILMAPGRLDA